MPRYLAVDYFSEALEVRQNILFRMLLAVPHHLECIDNYVHKGKKDDRTYNIPWQREFPEKLVHRTPQDDLCQITSQLAKLERFTLSPLHDEFIPSSNPDSPPINFDVWSDLEVEVVNYLVESLQPNDVEEFNEETFSSQDDKLLEEHTSQDFLHCKNQIPSVSSLCSRLRPKAVQDPFVDDKGVPLSEDNVIYGENEHQFNFNISRGRRSRS
ncbi:hypothetical protein AC249_AIPGENE19903 [Exaiptasia diaphana]|nr:hypothetical protein AC249_AIPGENE19903 [Exaiptasia diaphana]